MVDLLSIDTFEIDPFEEAGVRVEFKNTLTSLEENTNFCSSLSSLSVDGYCSSFIFTCKI
jgi:hypothetical protein